MLARKWRWEYCVSDRSKSYGICLPLTLDEYCCSILPPEMLRTRNYDQVLTRTKKSESKPEKLIVVSQLWVLWTRNKFVFSPENLPDSMGYLESYQRDLPAMFFVAKMIVRLLDYLDQPPSNAVLPNPIPSKSCKSAPIEEESILGSFQKAILFASEDVNRYYKDVSIKHIESDREKNYVHQMNDIREELSMIKRVLLQQERVWKDFAQAAWPEKDSWPDGPEGPLVIFKGQRQHSSLSFRDYEKDWDEIERIPARFSKYHRRINELNEDSARVEQAISAKLELMAKHATIRESHATAVMSAAVFGFSLVTIIFTPLSFFAALFALPIDRFQAAQDPGKFSSETGMYSTKYIGKWIATGEVVSIFVTLFAMWLVVKFGVDVHVFGPLWQMLRNLAGGISSLLTEKFLSGNEVKAEAVSTQSETRSGQTRTQKDGLLPGNTEQTEPVSSRSSKIGNGGNVDLERQ
ncbi:hypothetical protein IQ07DRAFT_8502 [Pyrenochaeta sp. DS3sAY3a]|nr:hypothetical protein IQ07DRAFT_8502 [Pyrenochaeta sp. DS3sAY3a]